MSISSAGARRSATTTAAYTWQLVHKPQIAVAGRRAIASRTGRLVGIDGPFWVRAPPPRPGRRQAAARLDRRVGRRRRRHSPYAARCLVWPAGWRTPANGTVKWSEFAVYDDADRTTLGSVLEAVAVAHARQGRRVARPAPSVPRGRGGRRLRRAARRTHETDDAALIAEAEAETAALTERPGRSRRARTSSTGCPITSTTTSPRPAGLASITRRATTRPTPRPGGNPPTPGSHRQTGR